MCPLNRGVSTNSLPTNTSFPPVFQGAFLSLHRARESGMGPDVAPLKLTPQTPFS